MAEYIYEYIGGKGDFLKGELVRCKDCNKHSNENELHEVWCEAYEVVKSENGYCDLGERLESSND